MTLENLERVRKLKRHKPEREEIARLLAAVGGTSRTLTSVQRRLLKRPG